MTNGFFHEMFINGSSLECNKHVSGTGDGHVTQLLRIYKIKWKITKVHLALQLQLQRVTRDARCNNCTREREGEGEGARGRSHRWRGVNLKAGATIDGAPCTATIREERADRNQYDVHHRMHLPPREPPAPCTTGKCIFRDTAFPHPSHILLGTRHAIDLGRNWGLLFFCNVRRRMHRSTD